MNLKEEKTFLIDIGWANEYTKYLQGSRFNMDKIDNSNLLKNCEDNSVQIDEDKHFVIIIILDFSKQYLLGSYF